MSFNGGKDCVVLLYLFQTVLKELKFNESIRAVYFQSGDQFSEEEDYVQSTIKRYSIYISIKSMINLQIYRFHYLFLDLV